MNTGEKNQYNNEDHRVHTGEKNSITLPKIQFSIPDKNLITYGIVGLCLILMISIILLGGGGEKPKDPSGILPDHPQAQPTPAVKKMKISDYPTPPAAKPDVTEQIESSEGSIPATSVNTPAPSITEAVPSQSSQRPDGKVSVKVQGSSPYQWGETIKLSGINSASDTVYLFFTDTKGKTMDIGYNLEEPAIEVQKTQPGTYTSVAVNDRDQSWNYNWNTSLDPLERRTITVYASSEPSDKSHIESIPSDKSNSIIIGAKPTPEVDLSIVSDSGGGDSF